MNTFSIENLSEDVSLIQTMSLDDIENFIVDNVGAHCSNLRPLLTDRKRQIKQQQADEYIEHILELQYGAICGMTSIILERPDNKQFQGKAARIIGVIQREIPSLYTGYRSKESIATGEQSPEHFNTMQTVGHFIDDYIVEYGEMMSYEHFVEVSNIARQVHLISKKENRDLMVPQKRGVHPIEAQDEVGVELIQMEDKGPIQYLEDLDIFPARNQ